MVTQPQGVGAANPTAAVIIALITAGVTAYKIWNEQQKYSNSPQENSVSFEQFTQRHQVYCAILETMSQLKIALDENRDIRYIHNLDKQLTSLMDIWNKIGVANEKA